MDEGGFDNYDQDKAPTIRDKISRIFSWNKERQTDNNPSENASDYPNEENYSSEFLSQSTGGISRRGFLVLGAGGATLAGVGIIAALCRNNLPLPPEAPPVAAIPKPTPIQQQEARGSSDLEIVRTDSSDGFTVGYNSENLPIQITSPDGTVTKLNPSEMKKLKDKKSGEPEIVIAIPRKFEHKDTYVGPEKDPILDEKPEGTLAAAELKKKYNVTIIQPPNKCTELSLDESIFTEETGLLHRLATKHPELSLDIVLLNGPVVSPVFMQNEAQRKYIPTTRMKFDRTSWLEKAKNELRTTIAENRGKLKNDGESTNYAGHQIPGLISETILNAQSELYLLEHGNEETVDWLASRDLAPARGLQSQPWIVKKELGEDNKIVILLGVGKSSFDGTFSLYLDKDGNFQTSFWQTATVIDSIPHSTESCPDPTKMVVDSNVGPSDYPVSGNGVGTTFAIRHECEHIMTSSLDRLEGKTDTDPTEKATDLAAYEALKKAWQKWQTGDPSGYPFIWRLPNGKYIRS